MASCMGRTRERIATPVTLWAGSESKNVPKLSVTPRISCNPLPVISLQHIVDYGFITLGKHIDKQYNFSEFLLALGSFDFLLINRLECFQLMW